MEKWRMNTAILTKYLLNSTYRSPVNNINSIIQIPWGLTLPTFPTRVEEMKLVCVANRSPVIYIISIRGSPDRFWQTGDRRGLRWRELSLLYKVYGSVTGACHWTQGSHIQFLVSNFPVFRSVLHTGKNQTHRKFQHRELNMSPLWNNYTGILRKLVQLI